MRSLELWLARRRLQKLERSGLLPGGRWLRINSAGLFRVSYLENLGRLAGSKRWFALTAYCLAKQGGIIRPAGPAGVEYQRQFVAAGEGENKSVAWYSLVADVYRVLADLAGADSRYDDK